MDGRNTDRTTTNRMLIKDFCLISSSSRLPLIESHENAQRVGQRGQASRFEGRMAATGEAIDIIVNLGYCSRNQTFETFVDDTAARLIRKNAP